MKEKEDAILKELDDLMNDIYADKTIDETIKILCVSFIMGEQRNIQDLFKNINNYLKRGKQ